MEDDRNTRAIAGAMNHLLLYVRHFAVHEVVGQAIRFVLGQLRKILAALLAKTIRTFLEPFDELIAASVKLILVPAAILSVCLVVAGGLAIFVGIRCLCGTSRTA